MSDEAAAPGDELDVLKVYVWVMLLMSVALAVVLWLMHERATNAKSRVEKGNKKLIEFAEAKQEIQAMINVYKTNKEDEARDTPLTWFSEIWRKRAGILDPSIKFGEWDESPRFDHKGNYYEENISIGFSARAPLPREKIAALCHEIERASTRLRVLELKISRAGKRDQLDGNEWHGKVMIGYRIPDVKE